MATVINDKNKGNGEEGIGNIPSYILCFFPHRLREELNLMRSRSDIYVEEIRIRSEKRVFLTTSAGNLMLSTVISRLEMDSIMQELCDGSLYAHSEAICQGYITLDGGVRVGICGRAAVEENKIIGVYSVSGLNFRIPMRHSRVGFSVRTLFESVRTDGGVLIYSPPGVGKTTLLRNIAFRLSSGESPMRVAVVDTRGEISPFLDSKELCVDLLAGYPKSDGISIAARTLNAQVIICDEIGEIDEARAIISAQNNGVPFIATAHARDVGSLLRRPPIRLLHDARVFERYLGISRRGAGEDYRYELCTWEAANDTFAPCGSCVACT